MKIARLRTKQAGISVYKKRRPDESGQRKPVSQIESLMTGYQNLST